LELREKLLFNLLVIFVTAIVVIVYILPIFTYKENDPETMDPLLAVGYLEEARSQGVPLREFFASSSLFDDVKREDPKQSFDYPRKHFHFEWMSLSTPAINLAYLPFVRLFGVSSDTIAIYSNFYCILTFCIVALLALLAYGKWCSLLSVAFLSSSLVWLIHVKVGGMQWMPSVLLCSILVLFLFLYLKHNSSVWLVLSGASLGLLYLTGWISFPFGALILGLGFVMGTFTRKSRSFLDALLLATSVFFTICVISAIYAIRYKCSLWDIHLAIFDCLIGRFFQGGVPGVTLSILGKISYAFKCMFIDMTQYDHLDKCLEGTSAVSGFFTLSFIVGLFYTFKSRQLSDRCMLLWFFCVFSVLCTVYLYAHRYAIMGLPAAAIIAARGVEQAGRQIYSSKYRQMFWPTVVIMVFLTVQNVSSTYTHYYSDYMFHKAPNYEIDRMRGHVAFSNWLKTNCQQNKTLVVLGDPVMFAHTCFLFNTFSSPYRFIYWNNHFSGSSSPSSVLDWEKGQLNTYDKIVFSFSTKLLGNRDGNSFFNDWRPFIAAHPNIRPVFEYSYDGRSPYFVVFVVSK